MDHSNKEGHVLALDIGEKRVGVAIASSYVKIASPLITLSNDSNFFSSLNKIIESYAVTKIVVGLPRTLEGNDSAQTLKTRAFIHRLKSEIKKDIITQDEALSSVRAEEILKTRGKIFAKADIDKLAACLILEDYLNEKV
jgi:putative Holliday junction resolvase